METKLYPFPDPDPHHGGVNWTRIIQSLVELNDPDNDEFIKAYFGNHDHGKSAKH